MRSLLLIPFLAAACSGDEPPCDPPSDFGCPADQACEEVAGSGPQCVAPLVARGRVTSASGQPIAGARVIAVNESAQPVADTAITAADGRYSIRLPSPRDAMGRPTSTRLKFRAGALGHGNFPDAWREWPTIDTRVASVPANENNLVVSGPASDISLIPFAGGPGRGILSGTVSPIHAGTIGALVVAEADRPVAGRPAGTVAWTDAHGNYALLGLASGDHRVRAYAGAGISAVRIITIDAGETTARLDLLLTPGGPGVVVAGTAPVTQGTGSPALSLVVASTWDAALGWGEASPFVDAPVAAGGAFSFFSVPSGKYLLVDQALDGYVALDPPVTVELQPLGPGSPAGFEVTSPPRLVPALAIVRPGAERPEAVGPRPELSWGDIAGEDHYEVDVVNATGQTVFTRSEPAHDGSSPVMIFDAPFAPGQLYRFRVRAFGPGQTLLAATEERRGVFYLQE